MESRPFMGCCGSLEIRNREPALLGGLPGTARRLPAAEGACLSGEKRGIHFWRERLQTDQTGAWKVSLPVPGLSDRLGPGALFNIEDNADLDFENIEVWSAPWFAFAILRNSGELTFRKVNVRPKPASGRLMSSWRDGFHAKGNSGRLLFEDCTVDGMNDDAFNISTHLSVVQRVLPEKAGGNFTEVPALVYPAAGWRYICGGGSGWQTDRGAGANFWRGLCGQGFAEVIERDSQQARAPVVTVELATALPGLKEGDAAWDASTSNPGCDHLPVQDWDELPISKRSDD